MQSKRLRRTALVALVVGAGAGVAPAWLSGSAPAAGTATAQSRSLPNLRGGRDVAHGAGRDEARSAVQHCH